MMDDSSNSYHISFFRPTTPQAKANRNMVVWLVSIWFIAIFGFQILLKLIEKPTPEPAYLSFLESWKNISSGNNSESDLYEFGQSTLMVLGKTAVDNDERLILDQAFSYAVYQLTPDSLKEGLLNEIISFKDIESKITEISDPTYIKAKKSLSAQISPLLQLSNLDVRTTFLPLELTTEGMEELSQKTKESLPLIMKKYLIHNQSVLTDTKFLGFPFHYFYTAVFLLILFIGLCLIYCIRTDNINRKLNIAD
jgi:putative solute:sodium symporter small subunit